LPPHPLRDSPPASEPGKLRAAVIVSRRQVPKWVVLLLDTLADSATVEVVSVAVAPRARPGVAPPAPVSVAAEALRRLDWCVFARRAELLSPADLEQWARRRGVPFAQSHSVDRQRAARDPATTPAAPEPQVVIDLSGSVPPFRETDEPRPAIWWPVGVPVTAGFSGAGLTEIAHAVVADKPTMAVEWRTCEPGASATVARAVCPTHPCSPIMTAAYLAVSAQQLIVGELERAQATLAPTAPQESPPMIARRAAEITTAPGETAADAEPPGVRAATARRCDVLAALGYTARSAAWGARRLGWVQQWHLLIGDDAAQGLVVDPSRLRAAMPPAGHFWADPNVFVAEDATHVLFEDLEYEDEKGRISVLTLDSSGRPGPARRILETDTHLSYPFSFRHEGRLFMIPESAQAESVDLYECVRVPDRWVFRRTLLSGVRLLDATVVAWQGLWWMFACLEQPFGLRGADVLVLYVTDDPVSGDWKRHPSSPIMADVTCSRPAGAPFVHDGRLYRPAQDGSRGYGWSVAVNEVTSLTTTDYSERRVCTVAPPAGTRGTHTLNRAGGTAVMDAWRWIPRNSPVRAAALRGARSLRFHE
jgi:hypothetical protein